MSDDKEGEILWENYNTKLGKETEKLWINIDGNDVICDEGEYKIDLDSDTYDMESSQCKLTTAIITASGYTRTNEKVECKDKKYKIGDICWSKYIYT